MNPLSYFKNVQIMRGIICSVLLFVLLAILLDNGADLNGSVAILISITSFLFGIFVSFAISKNHAKLNAIDENLKADSSILGYIYKLSEEYSKKRQDIVRKHMDDYLCAQIDYKLEDFNLAHKEFTKLTEYLVSLEPKNKKQELLYQSLLARLAESASIRRKVESLVRQKMSSYEWFSILSLLVIIVFSVFSLNEGSIVFGLASILLSTSATTLVFFLRDLDNLRWEERAWIWAPLRDLFMSLGLEPYYPGIAIEEKRILLTPGDKIRIAHYTKQYPDMSAKVIERKTV